MAEVKVTAEQAQQLLAGTTPGPWSAVHSQSGWAARPDRGYWEEDEADDIALIAAAPDLAETVIALYARIEELQARSTTARGIIEGASDHLSDRGTHDALWGRRILQGVADALEGAS